MSRSCEVIVIDSDDEVDDRKPAAKKQPSAAKKASASTNNNNNNSTTTNSSCISTLEEESSDDDDENPGRISHNVHNKRTKRKRPHHDNSNNNSSQRSTTLSDRELAEQLQRNEELGSQKSYAIDVEKCMCSTTDGKSWLLVQEMLTLIKSAKEQFISDNKWLKHYCVEAVAVDDMVYMAKDMLNKQNEFVKSGVSGYIDTGEFISFSCVWGRILACVFYYSSDKE